MLRAAFTQVPQLGQFEWTSVDRVKGGVFGTMQDTCCPSYAYPACQTRQQKRP